MPEEDLEKYNASYDSILEVGKAENPVELPPSGKCGRPKKGKVRALIERLVKYKEGSMPFYNRLQRSL